MGTRHIHIKPKKNKKGKKMSNSKSYSCPICGNTDIKYIGHRNGKPYCRKCITFRGMEATGDYPLCDHGDFKLQYELTKDQKRISDQLVDNFRYGINSLVHAVCGSGKTEIIFDVIAYALRHRLRVGYTVPRRDVIKEIYERFKYVFKNNKVDVVYGGHTNTLEADLICLTTHQLFRYEKYFDLLIIDEIDAFPYNDNEVLEAFFKRAIKGCCIMLSATPSEKTLKEFHKKGSAYLELNTRFHGHPLPVPKVLVRKKFLKHIELYRKTRQFLSRSKQVFIFCPTIEICETTYDYLKYVLPNGDFVHSKREGRSEIIDAFRKKRISYLVTTAVLERGVTIKDVQVIVFNADHPLYDSHVLIQISGRVGRKRDAPEGEVIFICEEKTNHIKTAINEIEAANRDGLYKKDYKKDEERKNK